MNKEKFEKIFSSERVKKYFQFTNYDESLAISLYILNIKISQSLYPILFILETSLRNSINSTMEIHFNNQNWFENLLSNKLTADLYEEIKIVKQTIYNRKEVPTNGKITAELTLGFWTRLFNSKYENELWKPLRLCFANMPKNIRQRKNIANPLNNIRNLRNRIYHYEPIIWNTVILKELIKDCYNLLLWIDYDLPDFTIQLDNSDNLILEIEKLKSLKKLNYNVDSEFVI